MLQELRIRNIALIEELTLSFSEGLNILTGETGAGKSIVLNAVQLLLGGRATEELVRSSEEEGSIEALFDLSGNQALLEILRRKGTGVSAAGEKTLLLKRVLSRSGRGKAYINGDLATLGMFSDVGQMLLSVYGQHEHQSLQRVETHIDILDGFGGLMDLRDKFLDSFEQRQALLGEVGRIRDERDKRVREQELLVFQSREIEACGLKAGEEEELREEQRILAHARKLMEWVQASEEMLYGEEGAAVEKIQVVVRQGREMAAIDPVLSPLLKSLESSLIQLEEVTRAFRNYERRIEDNPDRLEEIENRLSELDRLKRKYGASVEAVLRFKEEADKKIGAFTSGEARLLELESRLKSLDRIVTDSAKKLSGERERISGDLRKAIEKELSSLGMKKTRFQARFETVPLWDKGMDRVEFLLSPNPGEDLKPLARIASGGELSRIMLAMKRVLAKVGGSQVLIFDEVDSGIGGAMAEVVGRKLMELSKDYQVICVTHLPQIACFSNSHYSVRKEVKGGRTFTRVDRLEKEEVVQEIARMLGGVTVTDRTRAHAREMIENARKS
jgi:DNA repair protein RecN (Recombination protein N)